MTSYYFWDIENVSIHNLDNIMDKVRREDFDTKCYVVFAKIKEGRKEALMNYGWELVKVEEIARNSADKKIKEMLQHLLEDKQQKINKIVIITEDKGFRKTADKIIESGIELEIICATKDPAWVKKLEQKKMVNR